MALHTLRMHGIDRIVDAFHLEDALDKPGLKRGDEYELIEGEDFECICLLRALSDDLLFDLWGV